MSDTKRRALGKGLEALLPSRSATESSTPTSDAATATRIGEGRPLEIAISLIDRNPYQTRTRFDEEALAELATSIRANGVIQPILVRSVEGGRYQLIAGERRLLASKQAGKDAIPANVREATDRQTLEMTIVENLQRSDLNPMEQARAYQRLSQEFQLTQEEMAHRTGKERASVTNFMRLLRLPESTQTAVEAGELSFGHARALLALGEPERITAAAQRVRALSLSVRQTETYVQGILHPEQKAAKSAKGETPKDANVREAELTLQRALGLKVSVEDRRGRGRVIIEYAHLEDFDHIIATLGTRADAGGDTTAE